MQAKESITSSQASAITPATLFDTKQYAAQYEAARQAADELKALYSEMTLDPQVYADTQNRLIQDAENYAREQARIYEQMNGDIAMLTMTDYDYQKWTLDQKYADYEKYCTDRAALDQWYAANQASLEAKRVAQEVKQINYERKMRAQGYSDMLSNTSSFFAAIGEQSEAAFRIYQAIEIARTIASTYSAAQEAYKWGMTYGGVAAPAVAAAAAAAAVLSGLGRVYQIASLSPSSGATTMTSYSSDSGSGTTTATSYSSDSGTDEEEASRPLVIQIHNYGYIGADPDSLARTLVPAIRKAERDGV